MNIVRYVGCAFIFGVLLLLGYELYRYLDAKSVDLITVEQAWRYYNAAAVDGLGKTASGSYLSGFLKDVVDFLIELPLLIAVVLTGAFLLFISRHSDAAQ